MIKTAVTFIIILVLSAVVSLTGCGQDQVLSGSDRAAVLEFSEPYTDNLFAGSIANDYTTFSRDFDTDMLTAIPAANFADWKQDVDNNLGNYLSREVDQVLRSDEFFVVVYQAEFEQAAPVKIGVVFHAVEPHTISHLWIDTEKPQQNEQHVLPSKSDERINFQRRP